MITITDNRFMAFSFSEQQKAPVQKMEKVHFFVNQKLPPTDLYIHGLLGDSVAIICHNFQIQIKMREVTALR